MFHFCNNVFVNKSLHQHQGENEIWGGKFNKIQNNCIRFVISIRLVARGGIKLSVTNMITLSSRMFSRFFIQENVSNKAIVFYQTVYILLFNFLKSCVFLLLRKGTNMTRKKGRLMQKLPPSISHFPKYSTFQCKQVKKQNIFYEATIFFFLFCCKR